MDTTNQKSVNHVIDILSSRINRDKRIADSIEEDGDNPDTVKSLRAKVRRMGSARSILKNYDGCWG